MAKNKMKKTNTIHFGIQRKIVANMTTESWANVPHVTYNYEPDVTEFMIEYKRLNEDCPPEKKVTLNTLMLKIIVEGLKADPIMNSYIEFDRKLVRGEIHTFENIDISMPMVLPSGEMMTINLHNFENKNLDEMVSYIADVNRRVANTNLDEVMFDVSLDNTLTALKQGKIKQTLYRLIGSKTGKHKVKTLSGKEKSNYYKIPENDRLTKHDIEQGTITVSNIGSVYRAQRGETCLLEIVPPQVCAIAVGAVQDKPVVVVNEAGEKEIAIRQVMPLCIAFDHRALDFGEIVPFIKRLDEIFAAPEIIHTWRNTGISEEHMAEIKVEREQREAKYEQSKEREKARKDAEKAAEKARRDAEKARKDAEKAEREAAEKAKKADEKVKKEAEKARKDAEKAERDAAEKAEKARREAEKAKIEAVAKAEKAKRDAEEKARKESEKARKEAEKARAKAAEAKAKAEKARKAAEEIKTDKAEKAAQEAEKEAEKDEAIAEQTEKEANNK